ncbi:hypothetical protein [Frondihabitans cladoniiphilus]|uniref:Uncharacterized protein n=1 Tax=Frondihabitans cladoniiphilus TaxID=715785 RepID=A0ABP8VSZ5_9MICO
MSSTDGQPPLTRRQVRDLERAREAGEAITGSISVVSGSAVPSAVPISSAPAPVSTPAPASAPFGEHVPTRRELRAQRDAASESTRGPVPLKTPGPEQERRLEDALSHVADIEAGSQSLPQPVTFQQSSAASAGEAAPAVVPSSPEPGATPSFGAASADAAGDDAAEAPGPRRHGARSAVTSDEPTPAGSDPQPGGIGSTTPPPTSVPTVFPFVLTPGSGAAVPAPAQGTRPVESSPSAPASDAQQPAGTPPVDRPATTEAAPRQTAAAAAMQAAAGERPGPAAAAPAPASVPEPSGYVPPVGHWSTQADEPDDHLDAFGAPTGQQNAIVLDHDQLPDVTGALNATGEVIITGSIDLPRSLAATGSHHAQRIDGADIDRMLEEGDREVAENDAVPVRASRAVSANTSTRAVVLAAPQAKSNRGLIIASICGAVVIVGIVVVVVVSFARGVL